MSTSTFPDRSLDKVSRAYTGPKTDVNVLLDYHYWLHDVESHVPDISSQAIDEAHDITKRYKALSRSAALDELETVIIEHIRSAN